ncbi:MAG: hypothetical protein WC515_00470 [Candidatus Omnitrophota bacterium]
MGKRTRYIAAAAVLALAAVLYIFAADIMVRAFAAANGLDIAYKDAGNVWFTRFVFADLRVAERKSGVGFSAEAADIRIRLRKGSISADFNFRGVRLIREKGARESSYDSIDGLVASPFASSWKYETISGTAERREDGLILKDVRAVSDDIRLSVNGALHKDATVDADIMIYFSPNITRKVPEELTKVVLTDEPEGWKSISVKLNGNYLAPSIQLSSKLFRLNIRSVSP